MVSLSDTIFLTLLSHARFSHLATRPAADIRATAQVLLSLSAEKRGAVDTMMDRAAAAGGKADSHEKYDLPFMYGRAFEDPDGNPFRVMRMDVEATLAAQALPKGESEKRAGPVEARSAILERVKREHKREVTRAA